MHFLRTAAADCFIFTLFWRHYMCEYTLNHILYVAVLIIVHSGLGGISSFHNSPDETTAKMTSRHHYVTPVLLT